MHNQVTIVGNLGRDSELRYSKAGKPILSFSVAWNDKPKAQGEKGQAHWFNVKMFGGGCEAAAERLKKGQRIFLSGQLMTSTWEKDGQTQTRVEIMAHSVELITGAARQPQAGSQPSASPGNRPSASPGIKVMSESEFMRQDFSNDDIPF